MRFLSLLLCFSLTHLSYAQPGRDYINKVFPDSTVANYARQSNTPVILDMFSSNCIVCFKMLPKIKQLQKSFEGRVLFVLAGKEDDKIRRVYEQYEKKWNLSFPVIYDSSFLKVLGIDVYPTYAWIDRNGILKAITGVDDINQEKIDYFISNGNFSGGLVVKRYSFDPQKPFLVNENGGSENSIVFQVTFGKWQKGQPLYLPPSVSYMKNNTNFQAIGATLDRLCNYVFHDSANWDQQSGLYGTAYPRVVVEGDDQSLHSESFSISIAIRDNPFSTFKVQKIIKETIENYLGCQLELVVREMPCWFLYFEESAHKSLRSTNLPRKIEGDFGGITFRNVPVSQLISTIRSNNPFEPPIIDSTNFNDNIDLSLKAVMIDINDVQKQLGKNGIRLVKGVKPMKVIILKKKDVAVK